ncbi:MAG TPA: hypothetical protein GXX25_07070 [Desulfotomaculum sp.]|nr:hypothetical protein [Desulfotomaculum sp.]
MPCIALIPKTYILKEWLSVETPVIKPPEGFSPALQKALAWCPCCEKETPFGLDGRLGYARCVGCGISERDFYVRQFNGLWSDDALDKFVRAVEKSRRKYDRPFPWEQAGQMEQKACLVCKKPFTPAGNRQKYCTGCGEAVRKEQRKQAVYRQRKKEREGA